MFRLVLALMISAPMSAGQKGNFDISELLCKAKKIEVSDRGEYILISNDLFSSTKVSLRCLLQGGGNSCRFESLPHSAFLHNSILSLVNGGREVEIRNIQGSAIKKMRPLQGNGSKPKSLQSKLLTTYFINGAHIFQTYLDENIGESAAFLLNPRTLEFVETPNFLTPNLKQIGNVRYFAGYGDRSKYFRVYKTNGGAFVETPFGSRRNLKRFLESEKEAPYTIDVWKADKWRTIISSVSKNIKRFGVFTNSITGDDFFFTVELDAPMSAIKFTAFDEEGNVFLRKEAPIFNYRIVYGYMNEPLWIENSDADDVNIAPVAMNKHGEAYLEKFDTSKLGMRYRFLGFMNANTGFFRKKQPEAGEINMRFESKTDADVSGAGVFFFDISKGYYKKLASCSE